MKRKKNDANKTLVKNDPITLLSRMMPKSFIKRIERKKKSLSKTKSDQKILKKIQKLSKAKKAGFTTFSFISDVEQNQIKCVLNNLILLICFKII